MQNVSKQKNCLKNQETRSIEREMILIEKHSLMQEPNLTMQTKEQRKKIRLREGYRISELSKSYPRCFWRKVKNTYTKSKEKPDSLSKYQ